MQEALRAGCNAFAREETHLFRLLFIDDMNLKMTEAADFYKEIDNEKRAEDFSKTIGIELERAKTILHQERALNMKTDQYLINFYDHYDEENRFLSKHGSVEFLTTMRYIEKYIKPGDHVLEIGAGTGRYAHTLARQGYAVDAVELVQHNIEIFCQNTQPDENITITQGNAADLSAFSDNTYDITLLLGPLYHLYSIDDKRQAIKEAIRVTKSGGVIFAAYVISDGCSLLMRDKIDAMDDNTF